MQKSHYSFFALLFFALVLVATSTTQAVSTSLVINEVDYDQIDTDAAEYVEIKNISAASINLDSYEIVLVNGSGAVIYVTVNLPAVDLAANDYYVVCANTATVPNCDLDGGADTNFIQNGAPDAVAIRQAGTIIDTLSYEGDVTGYVEGTGAVADTPAADSSLSRCADGIDTDNNSANFILTTITPGAVNNCAGTPTATATTADETPTATATSDGSTPTPTTEISCASAPDKIYELQEGGAKHNASGTPSAVRTVVGIVTGDYQPGGTDGLEGYYVQDETGDANAATSNGIFVYDPAPILLDVTPGQRILLTGTTREQFGQTQFDPTSVTGCGTTGTITPISVTLPIPSLTDWEKYEGMLVTVSGADTNPLTVSETFRLAQFGEIIISSGGRLFQPTNYVEPGAAAQAEQELNNRRRLVIDDGRNNTPPDGTVPYIPTTETEFRLGFTTPTLTGVLGFGFSAYRLQPTAAITWTPSNPRETAAPTTNSRLRVASLNLLNYFDTFTGCFISGGVSDSNCRGADSIDEFNRQRPKTAAAILGLDADVVTVNELENDVTDGNSAIDQLVADLNAATAAGTWAFINTGQIGGDAIRVGMVYNTTTVTPVGTFAILDDFDPFNRNTRPPLAQVFEEIATGEQFIVIANHFKSKGSCPSGGDPNAAGNTDTGDGQSCWNADRVKAATEMLNWINTDPYFDTDPDVLIIGDLNSYAEEDPIDTIEAGGYTNLIETFIGAGNVAYSYTFQAQSGYLDHALASASFASQIVDAAEWHINADEPIGRDYNDAVTSTGESSNELRQTYLYQPNAFRSSDHDPVVVGIFAVDQISTATPTLGVTATPDGTTTPGASTTPTGTPDGTTTPAATPTTTTTAGVELIANGSFEDVINQPSLDSWTLRDSTSDGVKCNKDGKTVAHEGECAFRFKGNSGERAKLTQNVVIDTLTFNTDDTLNLTVYVDANKPTVSGKIKVRVQYTDGTDTGKINVDLRQTADYEALTGSYMLLNGGIEKIKVQIDHRSLNGKVYVDAVSLILTEGSGGLLPLP